MLVFLSQKIPLGAYHSCFHFRLHAPPIKGKKTPHLWGFIVTGVEAVKNFSFSNSKQTKKNSVRRRSVNRGLEKREKEKVGEFCVFRRDALDKPNLFYGRGGGEGGIGRSKLF